MNKEKEKKNRYESNIWNRIKERFYKRNNKMKEKFKSKKD